MHDHPLFLHPLEWAGRETSMATHDIICSRLARFSENIQLIIILYLCLKLQIMPSYTFSYSAGIYGAFNSMEYFPSMNLAGS